jgi:hypothetical protein
MCNQAHHRQEESDMEQRGSAPVNWQWITSAWRVFSGSIVTWVMMQLVVVVFFLLAVSPIVFLLGGLGILASREDWPGLTGLSLLAIISIPVILVLFLVGAAFLIAGLSKSAIRRARGEEIVLTDLFSAGDSFLGVLGYLIVIVVALITVEVILGTVGDEGSLLYKVASLIRSIADMVILGLTIFAIPIIVDRRVGVIEAIRESVQLTQSHWPLYALLIFISEFLSGLGFIFCLIGIVFTAHFNWTIPAVAYCEVFGLPRRPFTAPPPPPDFRTPPATPEIPQQPQFEWSTESPTLPLSCPHCGASLNRISQYCSQCGTRIGGH